VVLHPLLLGFIIAFWTATQQMSLGHLVFAVAIYILVAISFEERISSLSTETYTGSTETGFHVDSHPENEAATASGVGTGRPVTLNRLGLVERNHALLPEIRKSVGYAYFRFAT
jgi:hypothetical protein